jgi:ABC-type oligopeptide transport system substrate-binding subunit
MSYKVLNLVLVISVLGFIGCNNKSGKSGKSIYYNIGGEPTTINPLASSDGYAPQVQGYIFESLLNRDLDTYEWKPALATEWEISKDKKVFTFFVRV